MVKLLGALVALVVIVAAITVPDQDDYVVWVKQHAKRSVDSQWWNLGVELIGDRVIQSFTSCSSYVLWIACDTNISEDIRMKAIGLYGNFIPLSIR